MEVKLKSGMIVQFSNDTYAMVIDIFGKLYYQHFNGMWDEVCHKINQDIKKIYILQKVNGFTGYALNRTWQRNLELFEKDKELLIPIYTNENCVFYTLDETLEMPNYKVRHKDCQLSWHCRTNALQDAINKTSRTIVDLASAKEYILEDVVK